MAKANPHKNFKGQVGISLNGQSLRLQWTYQGKRYALSPGLHDTPENRVFAEKLAKEIQADIILGVFDPTLNKYRPQSAAPPRVAAPPEKKKISAVELFQKYFEFRRSDLALGTQKKYEALGKQLHELLGSKSADLNLDDVIRVKNWLSENFASVTAKDKICILQATWDWGINHKFIGDNPWDEIKFKKEIQERPKPFTHNECKRIIEAFRNDEPYYADFVEFRFSTGIRTGELIGLQWGDLSPDCTQLTVYRSYNSSTQELKPVKRSKIRTFNLPKNAVRILTRRKEQYPAGNEDLVFPAPHGGYLSARNFAKRQWRPVLESLGIDYRRPYNTRHTLASHALHQGMSVVDLASLLGNTPRTIYERYAGEVNEISPPELFD